MAAALNDAILAHGFTLESFGGHAHAEGVKQVAAARGPGILPDAAAAGRRLLAHGVDLGGRAIPGTQKLARVVRTRRRSGRGLSRPARGRARIARRRPQVRARRIATRPLVVGGAAIETARPHYENVLREERPDAVVGDVFSLDLALPLALKREDPASARCACSGWSSPTRRRWLRGRRRSARRGGQVECDRGGRCAAVAAAIA